MRHEEHLQRARGDRFWGIDAKEEASKLKKMLTERLKAQDDELALRARGKELIEAEKDRMFAERKIEAANEARNRKRLQEEEEAQCSIDKFWGVDKEERDRQRCIRDMHLEDRSSLEREQQDRISLKHSRWLEEETILSKHRDMLRAERCCDPERSICQNFIPQQHQMRSYTLTGTRAPRLFDTPGQILVSQ